MAHPPGALLSLRQATRLDVGGLLEMLREPASSEQVGRFVFLVAPGRRISPATGSRSWLEELHVDGFRYDYVPDMYEDGPAGPGYPELVYRTAARQDVATFQPPHAIIQCTDHLPDPIGILSKTYSLLLAERPAPPGA